MYIPPRAIYNTPSLPLFPFRPSQQDTAPYSRKVVALMNEQMSDYADLATRLERLEQQNRRLRKQLVMAATAVVIVTGIVLVWGLIPMCQAQGKAGRFLRAEGFIIVDRNGAELGSLGAGEGGGGVLVLSDAKQKAFVNLAAAPKTAFLRLSPELKKADFRLEIGEKGPSLIMKDGDGNVVFQKP